MDAATAALWASSITGAVALGGALLAPHLTAKRARETELLKVRRDAYVAALQAVALEPSDDIYAAGRARRHLDVAVKMTGPVTLMRLFASPDVVELYEELWRVVYAIATTEEEDKLQTLYTKHHEALAAFTEAARAHIGVDGIER